VGWAARRSAAISAEKSAKILGNIENAVPVFIGTSGQGGQRLPSPEHGSPWLGTFQSRRFTQRSLVF
jgi:hypothetical protein